MKKIYILTTALFIGVGGFAQQLTGSAGNEASNGTVQLSQSVGEVVVESSEVSSISQGYQQPAITITSIDKPEIASEVSIYPNPTATSVNVSIGNEMTIDQMTLYNMAGKLVWSKSGVTNALINIDMSDYNTGIYTLVIKEQKAQQSFQINKTH